MECNHEYELDRGCGAKVCIKCDDHEGLARCYCGWSKDGGDGTAQLQEMGEVIEPEDSCDLYDIEYDR